MVLRVQTDTLNEAFATLDVSKKNTIFYDRESISERPIQETDVSAHRLLCLPARGHGHILSGVQANPNAKCVFVFVCTPSQY